MPCKHCEHSAERLIWGGYSMRCVQCCARLIRSARPLKAAQDALLAAITMRPENPRLEAILLALRELDARLASQNKPSLPVSGMNS